MNILGTFVLCKDEDEGLPLNYMLGYRSPFTGDWLIIINYYPPSSCAIEGRLKRAFGHIIIQFKPKD